jgi:hypothetical protein
MTGKAYPGVKSSVWMLGYSLSYPQRQPTSKEGKAYVTAQTFIRDGGHTKCGEER